MNNNIINDCKMYLGLPPYNDWMNIVMSDAYFYMDMCKKYGEQNVVMTIKQLKGEI